MWGNFPTRLAADQTGCGWGTRSHNDAKLDLSWPQLGGGHAFLEKHIRRWAMAKAGRYQNL